MNIKVPKLIEIYLNASNESDLEKFLSCFSDTATVLDEGETLIGHEAIARWFAKTRKKYQFKSEPVGIEDQGEKVVLAAKVSGNFPGSPVNLKYQFKIQFGLIQDLRIA